MRKHLKTLAFVLGVFSTLSAMAQRKQLLDADWRFLYGDGSAVVSNADVANSWRSLNLPHDWSVETEAAAQAGGKVVGPFSTNSAGGYQSAFTVGGEGWYQKTISLTAADLAGRIELYFEGAYNQSWVYVNGTLANTNVYGYSSFKFDATDLLRTGSNSIVVKVQNIGNNTRWYAGSGIYRHVWLLRMGAVHLDEWDTYVNATENRNVEVSTTIHNTTGQAQSGTVDVQLRTLDGATVASGNTAYSLENNATTQDVSLSLTVSGAKTWSPDEPNLYQAVISVKDDKGAVTDSFTKRFGFRTLSFTATQGFLLNGESTLLKGGCLHHDNGLLGAAAYDKAELRKLQLVKAQGYNAVRCSHNLPSENFLDLCDSLGLMVIDECFDQWLVAKNDNDYHQYFATHSDDDLGVMLRRDRNHPSIIMWSIGNEIPGRIETSGMQAAARLRADVLKYDTTRPITAAICDWDNPGHSWDDESAKAFQSLDVGGYNYMYSRYEEDHAAYPDRVMFGAESYPKRASENWVLVERLPYVIGDFVWTAMDYVGEAGIGSTQMLPNGTERSFFEGWPWMNGWCGDIDLIGQRKPQSYYRDVVWHRAAVTMGVEQPTPSGYHQSISAWGWQLEEQSWTWPDVAEGTVLTVNVYSRHPRVRLYLNGTLLEEKATGDTFWAGFGVAYHPGALRAVAVDASGVELSEEAFELKTTGQPVGLRIVYDDPVISDCLNDLAYATIELVDADGNVVTSDSKTAVSITNAGAGELYVCGTASPTDMESFRSFTPTLFRGRALAIVRSNGTAGPVRLEAEIIEKQSEEAVDFFENSSFGEGSLNHWTISDGNLIRYNASMWHATSLNGFLECFVGWGSVSTLAGQTVSQSTKVLPAGQYTLAFDYNGTFRNGDKIYQTDGSMSGVTASIGGVSTAITSISATNEQHAQLQFTLAEPKAVTFLIEFASNTNADWFTLDNIQMNYTGDFDFGHFYTDYTSSIPVAGGGNWPVMPGNASGGYVENKLGSAIHNTGGLAYWSANPPTNANFFAQDITGLPAGRYGITSFCAANRWSGSDNDRNPQAGTYLFASTPTADAQVEVTTATFGLYSLVVEVDKGETLTLGMRAAGNNGNNWCYISDLTLVRLDRTLDEAALALPTSGIHGDVVMDRSLFEGWNTLVLPFDVDESTLQNLLGSDVQVVRMKSATEGSISFETVHGITANEPVLVRMAADRKGRVLRFDGVSITADRDPRTVGEAFDFVGTYVATTVDAGNYILGSDNSFKLAAGGNAIKGYRAYLQPKTASVKNVISFSIDDNLTGIETNEGGKREIDSDGAVYDLQGRRVGGNHQLTRGLYIVGGQKILIR